MTEAEFTGMDAGEYYAMKDFEEAEFYRNKQKEKHRKQREHNLRSKRGRTYDRVYKPSTYDPEDWEDD